MFLNKHSGYLMYAYLKSERCCNAQSTWSFFYKKTNVFQDFHICNSVPLNTVALIKAYSENFLVKSTSY